jgi:hypothetical protein
MLSIVASLISASILATIGPNVDYLTYHFGNARLGWNPFELKLTTSNVNSHSFGVIGSLPVDGFVYAQPLYVSNEPILGSGLHNIVIAATENDSVYAFDADTGVRLWRTSFSNPAAGITPVPAPFLGCQNIEPTIGITSTPVIDRTTNTVYVVAKTVQQFGGHTTFHDKLHALALDTGVDQTLPVDISGSVLLPNGNVDAFVPQWENNRAGLLLSHGLVYVAFGTHCDTQSAVTHGWLFAYTARTLLPIGLFNTAEDPTSGYFAGLWQAGFGIAADDLGFVYAATGNGPFDPSHHNFGDSVVKFWPHLNPLSAADYFTPFNQNYMKVGDLDLGSGGVMLLPDQIGAYPHLLVAGGKSTAFYLLNRDNLGGYVPGGPDRAVAEIPFTGLGVWGGPAYYRDATDQFIYYIKDHDHLKAYRLVTLPTTSLVFAGQSMGAYPGEGGSIPVVSSNGIVPGTGIVWATTRPNQPVTQPFYLCAYDATNVSHTLYCGAVGYWRAPHFPSGMFLTPTVVNGKVFIGTSSSVVVFGLK